MSGVGKIGMNGHERPRLWCATLTIELPGRRARSLVRRLKRIDKTIDRITVRAEAGAAEKIVAALEELARVVHEAGADCNDPLDVRPEPAARNGHPV